MSIEPTTVLPKIERAATRRRALDAEEIYQRIQLAIMERRLLPGAKLAEEKLAEASGASRSRIRQVLARLAHEQIVTLVPNKGAFIARPTTSEARELFLARRLIEPGLIDRLVEVATPEQIAVLREHVQEERKARESEDWRSVIRLSGEFHIRIAEMVVDGILLRQLRELVALNCLIITLYDKPQTPACPYSEHDDLVTSIEAGDAAKAKQQMLHHLTHIERMLNLDDDDVQEPDFEKIFC